MIKEKHTKLRTTEAFFSLQETQVYLSINKLSNGKRNMTVNVQHKIIVDDTRLSLRQKYRIGSHLYRHQFKFIVNHCMAPHGQLHHRCVVYISLGGTFDHFFFVFFHGSDSTQFEPAAAESHHIKSTES